MEKRSRPIPLLLMKYAAIFFLGALWWCNPLSAEQAADSGQDHEVIRRQKENYRIFFGVDDQRYESPEQSSRKLDMRDALVSTVVNYPELDTTDPTGGGGPVLHTADALFATHELGQLLRTKNPPSELAENNKYARTQGHERVLRDRIIHSGGNLTPADVMRMALDATGGNYSLAALTAHNLLKNVAYVGRREAELSKGGHLHLQDENRYVVAVASKLVNLRGNPAVGDKFGPWYHMYGILFLGSVTSGRTAEGMVVGEHFTRFLNVGSGEDREKQDWDWSIIFGMREIHASIYKGENQDAPATKQKQEQDEAKQKAQLDKAVNELTQEIAALDGLRKRIKDAAAEASAIRALIDDVLYNGVHKATLDLDATTSGVPADCEEEVSKIMAEIANLAAYVQGQADSLDKDYEVAESVVRQCTSKKTVEEIIKGLKARAGSAKLIAAKSNIEIGKKKERLADILYRAQQARESRAVNARRIGEIIALAQKGLGLAESSHAAAEKAGNIAGELEKRKADIRARIIGLRKDFVLIAPYAEPRLKLLEDTLANEPAEADLKSARESAAIADEKKSIFVDTKVMYEGLKKLTAKSPPLPMCENIAIQDDSDRRAAAALVYIEMMDGHAERIQEYAAACLAELGQKAPPQPDRVALVAAADCSMYPGSQAYWDENANKPLCGCPDSRQWNMEKTACVAKDLVDWVKELSGDVVGGASDSEGTTRKEASANSGGEGSRNELDSLLDEVAANRGVGTDARLGKQEMERQQREKSQYIESGPSSSQQYQGTFGGGSADNLGEKIGKAFTDILEANRKNDEERRKIEEDWQRRREQSRDAAARRQAERTREKPQSAQEGGASGQSENSSSYSGARFVVVLTFDTPSSHWAAKLPECRDIRSAKAYDQEEYKESMDKFLYGLRMNGYAYELKPFNSWPDAAKFATDFEARMLSQKIKCKIAMSGHNKTP